MNRFRIIIMACVSIIIVAVIIVVCNLFRLYDDGKAQTMETVAECAANADLLEIMSRMEVGEKAAQSFIRLNLFIESVQQGNSNSVLSDTIRTSLASILRFGLEFSRGKNSTDFNNLDSIFKEELGRHGLFPDKALMLPYGAGMPRGGPWWHAPYRSYPGSTICYEVYVSPMPGEVLSHMWGIVIPVGIVVVMFGFLSFYLIHAVGRLRTIEQMKDDFTHNMTHELKTPVAVAYSAADSMLRYYDQSDATRNKQYLRIILQRLGFLSGMIENILPVSMERFKKMNLNIEPILLKPLAEEISGMIELKAVKPIKIDIDIPDGLSVLADSLHLGNVLANLLDNAMKYSGKRVVVAIRANSKSIVVEDNGIGIPKDCIPYIFDKFYRVNSGDRYEVGGYGLGLFYVKQIVTQFGWDIDAASNPGQGTRFTIKFKSDEKR